MSSKTSLSFFSSAQSSEQASLKSIKNLSAKLIDSLYFMILNPLTWVLFVSLYLPSASASATESNDDGDDTQLDPSFSGTAFSLSLREMFEAAFITSMLLQSLNRAQTRDTNPINHQQKNTLQKNIAGAVAAGMTGAAAVSSLVLYFYHAHAKEEIGEDIKTGLEAVMKLLISVLVSNFSVEVLKMLSTVQNNERYDNAVDNAAHAESTLTRLYHIGKIPFSIFFIETIEAALLIGFTEDAAQPDPKNHLALAGSGLAGASIGVAAVACFHHFGHRISRNHFRYGAAALMALIGAGMANYATHEGQELQFFGPYESESCSTPWYNQVMWDASDCCSDKKNEFFKFMRTFLGYQDKPTPLELIAWTVRMGMTIKGVKSFLNWEKQQIEAQIEPLDDIAADFDSIGSATHSISPV